MRVIRIATGAALIAALSCIAVGRGSPTMPPARQVATQSTCLTPTLSGPTTVISAAKRSQLGLVNWPDTQPGFIRASDGTVRFTSTGYAANSGPMDQVQVTTTGSYASPVAKAVAHQRISGVPTTKGYDYVGAGPLWKDPGSGLYLQTVHLENALTPLAPSPFYTTVGLGLYSTVTRQTKYLGAVLRPQETLAQAQLVPIWTVNIDTPSIIAPGDGYLYMYSSDFVPSTPLGGPPITHALTVARTPIADAIAAAQAGTVHTWYKYLNGAWTSPGLGGASTDLQPGQPFNWQSNAIPDPTHGVVLIVSPVSTSDVVYTVAYNGYSTQKKLWSDPHKFDAYPTWVPDPTKAGRFFIYYLQWQTLGQDWKTAVELRRTFECNR